LIRDLLGLGIHRESVWLILARHHLERTSLPPVKPICRFVAAEPNDFWQIESTGSHPGLLVLCQKYREVYPGAVKSLELEIDDLLSFYQVKLSTKERQGWGPRISKETQMTLWRKIQTTNLIKKAFREVKRRTRPMGVFVNRASMERILYAVFFHYNSKGTRPG
jgi:transposase-like protein